MLLGRGADLLVWSAAVTLPGEAFLGARWRALKALLYRSLAHLLSAVRNLRALPVCSP